MSLSTPPTLVQRVRQVLGRALRESGQALDRVAVRMAQLTVSTKYYGEDEPVRWQDHLSRHRQQFPLLPAGRPVVSPHVSYLAPCATLIGRVTVHENASIWYGAILRADACSSGTASFHKTDDEILEETDTTSTIRIDSDADPEDTAELKRDDESDQQGGSIVIGKDSNIQDGCILTARKGDTLIGQGVTVGHLAQIHSATVGDYSLIGMNCILQEGCRIESEAFVAAGAVVAKDTVVPEGELWVGNPARKLRSLSSEERHKLHYQSSEYVQVGHMHAPNMELGGNLSAKMIDDAVAQISAQTDRMSSLTPLVDDLDSFSRTVAEDLTADSRQDEVDEAVDDQSSQQKVAAR